MRDKTETAPVRRSVPVRLAGVAVTVLGGIALGLLGTGGTYAYLSASAQVNSGALVTAGTAELSVSKPAGFDTFHPDLTQRRNLTVTNSGHVSLVLDATSTASAASQLSTAVVPGTCESNTEPRAPLGVSVGPGGTADLCLIVTLPAHATLAAAGAAADVVVTVTGTQQ